MHKLILPAVVAAALGFASVPSQAQAGEFSLAISPSPGVYYPTYGYAPVYVYSPAYPAYPPPVYGYAPRYYVAPGCPYGSVGYVSSPGFHAEWRGHEEHEWREHQEHEWREHQEHEWREHHRGWDHD